MAATHKNIVYGSTLIAGGNIHIGDIVYQPAELRHTVLFFRLVRKDQEANIFSAQMSVRSKYAPNNTPLLTGQDLLHEPVRIKMPLDAVSGLENIQRFFRNLDAKERRFRSSMPGNPSVHEDALAKTIMTTFFDDETGKVCRDFIALLEEGRIEELWLVISTMDEQLMNLPWELVIPLFFPPKTAGMVKVGLCPDNFCLLRTHIDSLERFSFNLAPGEPAPLRLLFVTALPENLEEEQKLLLIEEEQRKLIKAVGNLEARKKAGIVIEFLDNASPQAIREALQKRQHQILHISGHGTFRPDTKSGMLYLEDESGNQRLVSGSELGEWIRGNSKLRLIILNACETAIYGNSGVLQQLAIYGAPAIVAMRFAISDEAARLFTARFYSKLAEGASLTVALSQTREMLWNETKRLRTINTGYPAEWFTPVFHVNQFAGALVNAEAPYKLPEAFYPESTFTKTAKSRLIGEGFIGRKQLLIRLRRLFDTGKHVCLQGLGGMGKTTLAEAFAHNYDNRSHIVIIIRGKSQINETGIIQRLFDTFKQQSPGEPDLINAFKIRLSNLESHLMAADSPVKRLDLLIKNFLPDFKSIIIFDNFEDVQQPDGGAIGREIETQSLSHFIKHLLHAAPEQCHILFTTRYEITDLKEYVSLVPVGRMTYAEQYRLINHSETLRSIPFSDREAIYLHLAGHPRAYEFLEGLMANDPSFDPGQIQSQVSTAKNLAIEDLLLEEIYERLSEEEQAVFCEATTFIFQTPLAALTALNEQSETELVPILRSLSSWSVLFWNEASLEFEIHQLTREWVLSNHVYQSDWLDWSKKAGDFFKQRPSWHDEFLAAHHYEMAEDWKEFSQSVFKMAEYLGGTGSFNAAVHLLKAVLDKDIDPQTNIQVFEILSAIHLVTGNNTEALDCGNKWLEISRHTGYLNGEASALMLMGRVHLSRGDTEEALTCFTNGLDIGRRIGDATIIRTALNNIGNIHQVRGKYEEALHIFKENLIMSRAAHDLEDECFALNNIAQIEMHRGELDNALEKWNNCLEITKKTKDLRLKSTVLNNIGNTLLEKGEPEKAITLLNEALTISEDIGYKQLEAKILNNLARASGDTDSILELLFRSLNICRNIEDYDGEAMALMNIGAVEQQRGNLDKALEMYNQSINIYQEVGDLRGIWQCALNLGLAYNARSDYKSANTYLDQALEISEKIGTDANVAYLLNSAAGTLAEQDRFAEVLLPLLKAHKIYARTDQENFKDTAVGIDYFARMIGKELFEEINQGQFTQPVDFA